MLSAVLGHGLESLVIAVIVLFAVLLGFVQEYRAERAIEALRELAAPDATRAARRRRVEVPAREIVPGDVVRAAHRRPGAGRRAAARGGESAAEEAALTGESVPVEKHTGRLGGALAVGDRKNMVYAGTAVTYGRGRALVVATGMQTEFGRIAQLLGTIERAKDAAAGEPRSRRQRRWRGSRSSSSPSSWRSASFRGQPFIDMLIFGIALAVAVVPEALPAVVTISLALGVQRMVKRNALIRRLPAVETLGSTSVICSDKTGTLTKDEMTVRRSGWRATSSS